MRWKIQGWPELLKDGASRRKRRHLPRWRRWGSGPGTRLGSVSLHHTGTQVNGSRKHLAKPWVRCIKRALNLGAEPQMEEVASSQNSACRPAHLHLISGVPSSLKTTVPRVGAPLLLGAQDKSRESRVWVPGTVVSGDWCGHGEPRGRRRPPSSPSVEARLLLATPPTGLH